MYSLEILKALNMEECKKIVTPIESDLKLFTEDNSAIGDATQYRRLVGTLVFLCNLRPDINCDAGVLSQFSMQPHENHWKACMQILTAIDFTAVHPAVALVAARLKFL